MIFPYFLGIDIDLFLRNTQLLQRLPTGSTATATVQVAGRGRGSNVWVSPAGSLMFSTVLRHPVEKIQSAPVIFIQYLAAMAVVRGIKSYEAGYENLPVKLKWPNDICKAASLYLSLSLYYFYYYFVLRTTAGSTKLTRPFLDALDPNDPNKKSYAKICGILVNSHYSVNQYISVVGIGLNATNASPTTSLTALRAHYLPKDSASVTLEKLLARILTVFEDLYSRFLRTGFDSAFEDMYYHDWLHMGQVVTLEEEGGAKARIKGITRDYGFLLAEQLGWGNRPTGRVWQLQTDSNSFDFMKGLVRRKV